MRKSHLFLLALPCFAYLTADAQHHHAQAAFIPSIESVEMQVNRSGKEDLPFARLVIVQTTLVRPTLDVETSFSFGPPKSANLSFVSNDAPQLHPVQTASLEGGMQLRLSLTSFGLPEPEIAPQDPYEKYASLSISNEKDYQKAKYCLAEAVYFESRDQPDKGQRAVAQVIINRVKSPHYPSTICGVIYQNAGHRNACQFSYTCDGKTERVTEHDAWTHAQKVAEQAIEGESHVNIGNALFYHADWVWPSWRHEMHRVGQIGEHIFYSRR